MASPELFAPMSGVEAPLSAAVTGGATATAGAGEEHWGGDEVEHSTQTLVIERKRLYFNLRENSRGLFLKIAEVNRARRSTVIIPEAGLRQVRDMLDEMIRFSESRPAAGGVGGVVASRPPRRERKADPPVPESGQALWVTNLPWTTSTEEVQEMFATYGDIEACEVLRHKNSGRSRGVASVRFSSAESAAAALAGLNGVDFGGREMRVRYDRFQASA